MAVLTFAAGSILLQLFSLTGEVLMIYEITNTDRIVSLFDGWNETMIWSCLQGIMGKIYANDLQKPTAAMAVLGDFVFFAGAPDPELITWQAALSGNSPKENLYRKHPLPVNRYQILVPQNSAWQELLLQLYGSHARTITRYATKKEPLSFPTEKLRQIVSRLPGGCTLSLVNQSQYRLCQAEEWSSDLVKQFPDYGTYAKWGLGVVLQKDGRILSGASSYSRYQKGIEIEIDTREECRRQGFARICGAQLILECLKRSLYPSWDAHTPASLSLAQQLGYQFSHSYSAVETLPPSE